MLNNKYKKYFGIMTAGAFITLLSTSASFADCTSYNTKILQMKDLAAGTQTGGMPTAASSTNAQEPPAIANLRSAVQEAADAGCNLGPEFQGRDFLSGDGTRVGSEFAPSAPGESNATTDLYNSTQNASGEGGNSDGQGGNNNGGGGSLPSTRTETNTKPTTTAGGGGTAGTATPPASCGNIAGAYGQYLAGLSGAQAPTYKAGCAGANADSTPRTSPDNTTGQVCTGNQIGQFGLIQAAYNNNFQSNDVSKLAGATPANTLPNVVASKNVTTGAANEPKGCRLTNYASCGQVGDIILVQTKANAAATDPYDAYLIYAGNSQYYQVQTNGGKAVVKAGLPAQYANSTYSAVRQPCSSASIATGTTAGQAGTINTLAANQTALDKQQLALDAQAKALKDQQYAQDLKVKQMLAQQDLLKQQTADLNNPTTTLPTVDPVLTAAQLKQQQTLAAQQAAIKTAQDNLSTQTAALDAQASGQTTLAQQLLAQQTAQARLAASQQAASATTPELPTVPLTAAQQAQQAKLDATAKQIAAQQAALDQRAKDIAALKATRDAEQKAVDALQAQVADNTTATPGKDKVLTYEQLQKMAAAQIKATDAQIALIKKQQADQQASFATQQKDLDAQKKVLETQAATIATQEKELAAAEAKYQAAKALAANQPAKTLTLAEQRTQQIQAQKAANKTAVSQLTEQAKAQSQQVAELKQAQANLEQRQTQLADQKKYLEGVQKTLVENQKQLDLAAANPNNTAPQLTDIQKRQQEITLQKQAVQVAQDKLTAQGKQQDQDRRLLAMQLKELDALDKQLKANLAALTKQQTTLEAQLKKLAPTQQAQATP